MVRRRLAVVVQRAAVRLCRGPGPDGGRHHGAGHQLGVAGGARGIRRIRERRRFLHRVGDELRGLGPGRLPDDQVHGRTRPVGLYLLAEESVAVIAPEEFLEDTRDQGLKELEDFLRIPSISSQPERSDDVRRAAAHLAEQYERIGLENAEVIETAGHPVVYADWLKAPGKPTALLYGHYDVQPVDPLDLWTSPPFEPRQQDGLLFGRGTSDDKGQIALHWQAIHAWPRTTGQLPLNPKVLAEGEEEISSIHFEDFVRANRDRLKCDYCVISDTTMVAKGFPAITYALRGLIYFELRVEAATVDMHSGLMGGMAPNPAQALAEIIVHLKDPTGHVLVAGFYDGVRPLLHEERRQFARIPFKIGRAHV